MRAAMARASSGDTPDSSRNGSLQLEPGPGVGIRSQPAYPGERTGDSIKPGEIHEFKAQVVVQHEQHNIFFYELDDGRG